jgi:hypothetical protein
VVIGVAVVVAGPAAARTYRWIDPNGNVMYTDHPPRPEDVGAPAGPDRGGPGTPGAAPGSHRPVHPGIDELLALSGLKGQMRGMAMQTRDHLQGNMGQLEPRDRKAVEAVTARALDPDLIYGRVLDEFSQHVDEARLAEAVAWFRSPLGRKLTELEVAFSTVDRQREITQFVAQWRVSPPSRTRVALVQRLDAAAGATELSVELVVAISQAIVRVADPYLPPERRLKPGQLESQARQIRLQALEALRQGNTISMLYLYRNVEDTELARYIRFLESEAGAWYGNAVRRAVTSSLGVTVERTAGELVRIVPPQRWGGPGAFKKPALPPADAKL